MTGSDSIIMYGAMWCGDCRIARKFFDRYDIAYTYIDVDQDEAASARVIEINEGMRTIPTIILPDNSIMVEPSVVELAQRFNKADLA